MPLAPPDPTRRRRWPLAAGLLTLALIGVALGEWRGWPFLAGPLADAASKLLDRQVTLTAAAGAEPGGFQVRFFGGLRGTSPMLQIAAPTWSPATHMLLAHDVELSLRYADLWAAWRGQPLRVQSLRARTLDAQLERRADGRASWQFGDDAARQPVTVAPPLPSFDQLSVDAGTLTVADIILDLNAQARWSLVDGSTSAVAPGSAASAAGSPARLEVNADGRYRQFPLHIELRSAGVLPWVARAGATTPVPLTLKATIGRAGFSFDGSAADALHLSALAGRFTSTGPSLAAVGDPLGVTLPTTGAFKATGRLVKEGAIWRVVIDAAAIGDSRLAGAFSYDPALPVPMLAGRLTGTRLGLADLGPAVGTRAQLGKNSQPATAGAPNKVLPDRPFDLHALRVMDANVLVDIAEVDLDTRWLEPLRPLRGHLQLVGGVLSIERIDARTGQGRLGGDLRLDGRSDSALWNADLRWSGVQLESWIRQDRAHGAPPWVSGRLDGSAVLRGRGRSTAAILADLSGPLRTELHGGHVSHLLIEAAGIDLAQALGVMVKGDDALPVSCAVADLVAERGVLRPKVMVLDTTDSAVWVDGTLSLASETMDLRAVVMPKDFSPLTLRSPLRVSGSLSAPRVSLESAKVARKLGASLLLALISPLAALIPLIDPGDRQAAASGAAGCHALVERVRPTHVPASKPKKQP